MSLFCTARRDPDASSLTLTSLTFYVNVCVSFLSSFKEEFCDARMVEDDNLFGKKIRSLFLAGSVKSSQRRRDGFRSIGRPGAGRTVGEEWAGADRGVSDIDISFLAASRRRH